MGGRELCSKLKCLSMFKIEIAVGTRLSMLKISHSGVEI